MKRLDKVGLDYLILMAKDIGFAAVAVDSKESESCAPRVCITFEQTRDLATAATSPASVPMGLKAIGHISGDPSGVSGLMGSTISSSPADKMRTIDEDKEGPACSPSKS